MSGQKSHTSSWGLVCDILKLGSLASFVFPDPDTPELRRLCCESVGAPRTFGFYRPFSDIEVTAPAF